MRRWLGARQGGIASRRGGTRHLGRSLQILVLVGACGDDQGTSTDDSGDITTATATTDTGSDASTTTTTGPSTTPSDSDVTGLNPQCPPSPGEWIPQTLPVGETDVPYEVEITAENWDGEVFANIQGEVPEGLGSEETSGGISLLGVPTEAGTFPLTVHTFTGDGGNCWPPKSYELVIEQGADTSTGSTGTDESTGESGSSTTG